MEIIYDQNVTTNFKSTTATPIITTTPTTTTTTTPTTTTPTTIKTYVTNNKNNLLININNINKNYQNKSYGDCSKMNGISENLNEQHFKMDKSKEFELAETTTTTTTTAATTSPEPKISEMNGITNHLKGSITMELSSKFNDDKKISIENVSDDLDVKYDGDDDDDADEDDDDDNDEDDGDDVDDDFDDGVDDIDDGDIDIEDDNNRIFYAYRGDGVVGGPVAGGVGVVGGANFDIPHPHQPIPIADPNADEETDFLEMDFEPDPPSENEIYQPQNIQELLRKMQQSNNDRTGSGGGCCGGGGDRGVGDNNPLSLEQLTNSSIEHQPPHQHEHHLYKPMQDNHHHHNHHLHHPYDDIRIPREINKIAEVVEQNNNRIKNIQQQQQQQQKLNDLKIENVIPNNEVDSSSLCCSTAIIHMKNDDEVANEESFNNKLKNISIHQSGNNNNNNNNKYTGTIPKQLPINASSSTNNNKLLLDNPFKCNSNRQLTSTKKYINKLNLNLNYKRNTAIDNEIQPLSSPSLSSPSSSSSSSSSSSPSHPPPPPSPIRKLHENNLKHQRSTDTTMMMIASPTNSPLIKFNDIPKICLDCEYQASLILGDSIASCHIKAFTDAVFCTKCKKNQETMKKNKEYPNIQHSDKDDYNFIKRTRHSLNETETAVPYENDINLNSKKYNLLLNTNNECSNNNNLWTNNNNNYSMRINESEKGNNEWESSSVSGAASTSAPTSSPSSYQRSSIMGKLQLHSKNNSIRIFSLNCNYSIIATALKNVNIPFDLDVLQRQFEPTPNEFIDAMNIPEYILYMSKKDCDYPFLIDAIKKCTKYNTDGKRIMENELQIDFIPVNHTSTVSTTAVIDKIRINSMEIINRFMINENIKDLLKDKNKIFCTENVLGKLVTVIRLYQKNPLLVNDSWLDIPHYYKPGYIRVTASAPI